MNNIMFYHVCTAALVLAVWLIVILLCRLGSGGVVRLCVGRIVDESVVPHSAPCSVELWLLLLLLLLLS